MSDVLIAITLRIDTYFGETMMITIINNYNKIIIIIKIMTNNSSNNILFNEKR